MYSSFVLIPLISLIALNLPFRWVMKKAAFWLVLILAAWQVLTAAGSLFGLVGLPVDRLAAVALVTIGLVSGAALIAGKGLIGDEEKGFNFANLLLVAIAGMNGIALARDVFSLYVFIEVTAVASYILIALDREKDALGSAFKYIILSSAASAMMLAAIALMIFFSGSTQFDAVRAALSAPGQGQVVALSVALFVCGLFIKGGLMPFHGWLPGVYSTSPAPVSVLLAGTVTKILGIFTLIRFDLSVAAFSAPVREVVLLVGTLSIVAGALAALGQNDFKRMLAYSSISQVGYIVIGLGAGNPLGIMGAVFHLFNHSVFKSTLFLNSASLESRTGTREISRMGGLAAKMPVTAVTSAIAWLSAAGIPPFAGFWSKLLIVVALWIGGYRFYAALAVAASILTLAYFLYMQRRVFSGHARDEFADVREAGIGLILPVCALSAITVGVGIAFPLLFKLLWR